MPEPRKLIYFTPYRLAFCTFLLALIIRLPLAILEPVISPDGDKALLVAQNMLQNACISISDPLSGACVPHWGGNHLPGYPTFLAVVRLLGGAATPLITAAQTFLVALALCRFVFATSTLLPSLRFTLGVGLIAALSPVQIAWVRFFLPDALLVAATLWIFAELWLSIVENRLRIVPVGLGLLAATFLRYDGVLLAVPVAMVGFSIHPIKLALARSFVIFLIVALPISAYFARNVSQGLTLVPRPGMVDGSQPPAGYFEWGNTWITNITQGGLMAYGVWQFQYQRIEIDPAAYASDDERQTVRALLDQLRSFEGQPFPPIIDQEFARIAAQKRDQNPLKHYLLLPLKRMAVFWFYPNASFGWPLELGPLLSAKDRRKFVHGTITEKLEVVALHPLKVMGKAFIFGYRIILVSLALLVFLLIVPKMNPSVRVMMWSALSYSFLRTLVLAYQTSIDNRYMISAMAALEFATAVGLGYWLQQLLQRSQKSRTD